MTSNQIAPDTSLRDKTHTRLRRAIWLSAKRKELMCVFARNFHYVVPAKHQLVAKALKKEHRRPGCDVESFHGREAIPEDMGVCSVRSTRMEMSS